MTRTPPACLRPVAEAMERRILHSADIGPLLLGGAAVFDGASLHSPLHTAQPEAAVARQEIVFVDTTLPDAGQLLADLQTQRSAGRPLEIVTLDSDEDGLLAITRTLAGRQDIAAVHVLTHGADGQLQLGSTRLDAQALMLRAGEVAAWGSALAPGADLLLYGCDVAQSDAGRQFVRDLAALTGADVAASTDLTGAATAGGDWALEYVSGGAVEAAIVLSPTAQTGWAGALTTYTVTSTADSAATPGTLRWAINQANLNPGADTIVLPAGTYRITLAGAGEALNLTGDFNVSGDLSIVGANAGTTFIDANGLDRAFRVHSGTLNLSQVTVENGSSATGGAVRVEAAGSLDLRNAVLRNNVATGAGGGAISSAGTLTVASVTFNSNSTAGLGGALHTQGNASATLSDLSFTGNSAQRGGAIYGDTPGATLTVRDAAFSSNTASNSGGAIHMEAGTLNLSTSTFTTNRADGQGGALFLRGDANLSQLSISGGQAASGGGIYQHEGTLTISATTLSGNRATANGGGLFVGGGNLVLDAVSFNANVATGQGGGLYLNVNGRSLAKATFSANQADQGGGLYISGSNTRLSNLTLSGNTASTQGGGLYANAKTTLLNVTVADNVAAAGGGIFSNVDTSQFELTNTLLANNGGGNANIALTSGGHNLSTDNSAALAQPTDIVSASAGLAALADNGGGTATRALLAGSAAINAGSSAAAPAADQRGTARSGAADIGAFEYSAAQTAPTISAITNRSVAEDTTLGPIAFAVGDGESAAATLVVTAASSDTALLPSGNLTLGGSGANRTLTLTPAANAVGGPVTVTLTVSDGVLSSSTSFTVTVTNVNDAPTGSVNISGTPTQGQTLSASHTLADIDGLGLISYQWHANGTAITGATGSTHVLTQAEVGQAITVVANYTDGQGTAEAVSSAATALVANVNDAPTGSVNISGTPTQGQTLSVSHILADIDGLGAVSYEWRANGTAIAGATGSSHVLTQAEVGQAITVVARYTDGQGTAEAVGSAATALVANVNDAPTGSVNIAGTPTQGQTLSVSHTLADIDGLGAVSYQWRANGTAIAGATGSSHVLTQAEVGQAITVTASYTDGQGTAEAVNSAATALVANVNDAPTGSVNIAGTPTQGQTLSASHTLADIDGLGVISYQWRANGTAISGATGSSHVLTQAEVGQAITVVASYTDGQGTTEAVGSAATALVANVNDAPTGSVNIAGTPTQGQTLSVSHTLADADGLGVISYQWRANGTAISGATGSSHVLTQAEVGQAITVTARYIDGQGTAEAVNSAATPLVANVNDPPTGSVNISGTPTQGQTLSVSQTLADADGLGAVSYQWRANGTAITGATGSSHVLTQAEVGQAITVVASYTDGQGTAEAVSSAATALVANVNDAPTGSVNIAGTPIQGQTLSASQTLADIDGLGVISYQWRANGTAISGATGSSHVLTQAEVGQTITVLARYTDAMGTAEAVSSAATALVANINDAPTGSVTIGGTPTQGQTLNAISTLADADGLGSLSYLWRADGAVVGSGSSHTLTQAEVGRAITVVASYTDGQGTAEAVGSPATAPVANINDAPSGSVNISGTPTQGQTLSVSHTLTDADGLGAVSYTWLADGSAIGGATGSSLVLTQAQVGKVLTVTASYTDGYGRAESVSSAATAAVANVNDAPSGLPAVTGTALEGQTLRADVAAIADIDGLGAISYQWLRDGSAIAGATGAGHLLGNADVGALLSVRVSHTDGQGTAETLLSAASSAVIGVNETPVLSAALASQTATLGSRFEFTLPEGSFTDPDIGDTLRYTVTLDSGAALPSWLVFDANTRSFSGTPGASDLGVITLRVTATDSEGLSAEARLTISAVLGTLPEPVQAVAAPAAAQPEAEAQTAAPAAPAPEPEPALPALPVDTTPGLLPAPLFAPTVIDTAAPAPARSGSADETQETTRVAIRSVSLPAAQEAMAFGDLSISPMQNLLRSDELLRRLDTLRQQMSLPEAQQRTAVAQSIAVTSGLSIGYVVWLVRGGVLMSSMLSALPAWQMVDPMPILAAAKPRRRKDGLPDAEDADLERLFDQPRPAAADHPARPAPVAAQPALIDAEEPR